MPGLTGCDRGDLLACFLLLHARLRGAARCARHSLRPSDFQGEILQESWVQFRAAGIRGCCLGSKRRHKTKVVMPGRDPGIHRTHKTRFEGGWMAGSSPAMTKDGTVPSPGAQAVLTCEIDEGAKPVAGISLLRRLLKIGDEIGAVCGVSISRHRACGSQE